VWGTTNRIFCRSVLSCRDHAKLEFLGGRPEKVTIRLDGSSTDLKDPWEYSLPAIPNDQWQITFRVIVSPDLTGANPEDSELEIPIRFSRYHGQLTVLRVPIYILTSASELNNSFVGTFEYGGQKRTR
jgi:hypothetical protein